MNLFSKDVLRLDIGLLASCFVELNVILSADLYQNSTLFLIYM